MAAEVAEAAGRTLTSVWTVWSFSGLPWGVRAMMQPTGMALWRAIEAFKSSNLQHRTGNQQKRRLELATEERVEQEAEQSKAARRTHEVSCDTFICRRWPEWAINTCVAISRHARSTEDPTASKEASKDDSDRKKGRRLRIFGRRNGMFCESSLRMPIK